MRKVRLIVGTVLILISSGAFAQQPPQETKKEVVQACENDIKKFCSKVQPGEGRIENCLKKHQKGVSAQCKQAVMFEKAQSPH
jgi:hypothetical protein